MNVTRVLLIEDNPGDAELIAVALGRAGEFQLEVRGRLSEGVERMVASQPDLVLLDLGLPDSEGLATFITANRCAPHIPIVVLTGSENDTLALQAVREGAQDYLVKGVDPSRLLRSLRYALERKKSEEALRLSQAQLAGAQRLAQVGSFLWNIASDTITWSDELYRIFGLERKDFATTFESFVERIHPDDREMLQRTIGEALKGGSSFEVQERIVRPNGEVRVLDSRGEILLDAGGAPVRILGVCQDITERKKAEDILLDRERELRAARDQAVQASEFKSQFLANMSHEIRTPMNGVLGLAHLLLEMEGDPEKRNYLLALRDSGQNLLAIINDILDFSKVEAGRLELEEIEFDLPQVVATAVSLFKSQAIGKGLALELDVPATLPKWVRGDPVRVRQILTNLINNAVKFTDAGRVRVQVAAAAGGRYRFEVSDTGIGIDPAYHDRLLDPFRQADSSTTRRFGGTGLGIPICRQLVALMDGAFDYDSEPGKGSTFWFEIPLSVGSRESAQAILNRSNRDHRDRVNNQREAAARPGTKILLVEDNAVNRLVAKAMLERLGYQVDVAGTGVEAVEAAREASYAFILMDCLMPVMDGYEATAQIRKMEGPARRTPIIALTALAMTGDKEKCLAAGMDDYLSKPLAPEGLAAVLERCRVDAGAPDAPASSRAFRSIASR
ncbi:MAG: response regulator [Actinomycetota bacterium]